MSEKPHTVILYHAGCPDGFGAAYAAWKKFGTDAEYIPVMHGFPPPEDLEKRELFFVDFCYPQDVMDTLLKKAESVTVLDHHLGNRDVVESIPQHVFDKDRSGATIAWSFFHPETPVPLFLRYVQEGDLYTFRLPDSHAVLSYCYAQPFHFEAWDSLATRMGDDAERAKIIERGTIYAEYHDILVEQMANKAKLVLFEGHECYLANTASMFASDLGNNLAKKRPPMGIVVKLFGEDLHVSLRSLKPFDVSEIARKYGGNGHPQAAAFLLRWGDKLPWTFLEEDEAARH